MSAIWGIWHRDGRPRAGLDVERMHARLACYGQDAHRQWTGDESSVAMGLAATYTLPEEDEDGQPYTTRDGSVLIGHVRLDNRAELISELGLRGAGVPDMEILARAWERWGEETAPRLLGDFAFTAWAPGERRLYCVRDPLGIRPLHYAVCGPLFAFATAPKGLHALDEFPRRPDAGMIAGRLALLPESGAQSFFENIHRVPPAHLLMVSEDHVRVERYRNLDTAKRIEFQRDGEYVEAFLARFDEAVRCRIRSRGPTGSLLSGGLDSSSVTTSAAMQLAAKGEGLDVYTSVPAPGFNGNTPANRFGDEGPHAASVAAMYPNIRHHLVPPSSACPLDLMADAQSWTDSPGGHFCMSPSAHAISALQAQHGVRTVLSGVGGNMTISYDGIHLLPSLIRGGSWIRWLREARALRGSGYLPHWRAIAMVSAGPMMPARLWKLLLRDRPEKVLGRFTGRAMLEPEWVRSGELEALSKARQWDVWSRPVSDGRTFRARAIGRLDGAGSASAGAPNGTEYRDPTVDLRVIEFLLAIPEDQFLRNGQTKWLLRRAMSGRLSPLVLKERRKGLAGADWYLRVAPYRDRFAAAIEECGASPILTRLLDLSRMRRLIDQWPRANWDSMRVANEYRMGLCRAISMGQFVRWVEQGNT